MLALAAALAAAAPAGAAAAPDTAHAAAAPARDSARTAPAVPALVPAMAPADTSGASERARVTPFGEQPRAVMLRSLLVPGWGQLHNHAWIKALAVAGGEGWLLATIFRDRSDLRGLQDDVNAAAAAGDSGAYTNAVNRYNDVLDGYVGGQWLLGGVLAYALVDAYVDAHFRRFDIDFRNDPALPRGEGPGTGGGGASGRLSLRWHF